MGMGGLFNSFIRPSEKLAVTSHGDGVNGTKEDTMFTLERQEFFIQDALKRVRQAANKDKTIQVISGATEEEDVDRDAALAAMMGINHGSEDTSAAPIDKTAVRARRSLDRVEAVRGCATLECLRVAHEKPPGKAKFNFPHFMIVGFQKSATTSLHYHLVRHPSVSRPWDKEPEFFSESCGYDIEKCDPDGVRDYIQRVLRVNRYAAYDGQLAHYEASTHYSRAGKKLAPQLVREFPWLKVILLIREPISRAASMLVHILDKNMVIKGIGPGGCLKKTNMDLGTCLLQNSQISGQRSFSTNYSAPLEGWLNAFPKGQIYIGQYEALIDENTQEQELQKIKKFIGIDPNLPTGEEAEFLSRNSRKDSVNPDGWQMRKDVYEKAIDIVLEDSKLVAQMVELHGFGDSKEWMARWQSHWDANLQSCDNHGNCMITLS
jgi:hypothetical protein